LKRNFQADSGGAVLVIENKYTHDSASLPKRAEEKWAEHAADGSLSGQDVKRMYHELLSDWPIIMVQIQHIFIDCITMFCYEHILIVKDTFAGRVLDDNNIRERR
jgi:hypothetical protein